MRLFKEPTPRMKAMRAGLADSAWAGFVVRPDPVRIRFAPDGRMELMDEADGVMNLSKNRGEMALLIPQSVGDVFLEICRLYEDRLKPRGDIFMEHVELGLFFEFVERDGAAASDMYLCCFLRNIAEYQAADIAKEVGTKLWFTPKAYHEGGTRLRTRFDKMQFLGSLASDDHRRTGGAWDHPDMDEWKKEGWLDRCPGIISISIGARMCMKQLGQTRFKGMEQPELMQRMASWMRARAQAGSSLLETAQLLGVADRSDELAVNMMIPLHEEEDNR